MLAFGFSTAHPWRSGVAKDVPSSLVDLRLFADEISAVRRAMIEAIWMAWKSP
jgi:hypothetical protein